MRARLVFIALIAVAVAVAMKVVGILLVTAMLIVPASRGAPVRWPAAPEAMAARPARRWSDAWRWRAVCPPPLAWDLPSGPAIVAAAVALFVLTFTFGRGSGRPGRRRAA